MLTEKEVIVTLTDAALDSARRRAEYLTGLMWHAGTFVIINAFLWLLDAWSGGGLGWSVIVTAVWGVALAFHALAYWVDGRQVEARRTEQYLSDARDADE